MNNRQNFFIAVYNDKYQYWYLGLNIDGFHLSTLHYNIAIKLGITSKQYCEILIQAGAEADGQNNRYIFRKYEKILSVIDYLDSLLIMKILAKSSGRSERN